MVTKLATTKEGVSLPDYSYFKRLSLWQLMELGLKAKLGHRGLKMGLCTITNAKSGACSEDCAFCAQSARARAKAPVYDLKELDALLYEAEEARNSGAQRFSIVISGKGPSSSLVEKIARYIEELRRRVDIGLCASLGIMGADDLKLLKEAGLSRYHHNLEASKEYFPKICTTHSYEERVKTIKNAKSVGLDVCAGGIIGLGESEHDRYLMARDLAELEVDSCPINILVPIAGTPLEGQKRIALEEIFRTVAMWRIMLPHAAIRIAGGREKVLKDLQSLAFMAGADAMLIGGYLTTRGRPPEEDIAMAKELRQIWAALLDS